MNHGHLRTFVTVVRHRSFSRAAETLHLTQSAVSQHIAALEKEMGLPLLRRRPVTPTEGGARLMPHAESLLFRLEVAREDVTRARESPLHPHLVARTPLVDADLLASALANVDSASHMRVHVNTVPAPELHEQVIAGGYDLGLASHFVQHHAPDAAPDEVGADRRTYTSRTLRRDRVCLVLPTGHPMARHTSIKLDDVRDMRWVDAPECSLPLNELRVLLGEGLRDTIRCDGTAKAVVLAMVSAGLGVTLLPPAACRGVPGIKAVPLASPLIEHRTLMLHSSQPTLATLRVVQSLERVSAHWPPSGTRNHPEIRSGITQPPETSPHVPTWGAVHELTGLTEAAFTALVKLLDSVEHDTKRGRPWSLGLRERLLLLGAYWRTDRSLREVADHFKVSKSTANRIIADLAQHIELKSNESDETWLHASASPRQIF
ncbi:LysR family transcriptional regulator [Streptomyces sp. NPDC055897]